MALSFERRRSEGEEEEVEGEEVEVWEERAGEVKKNAKMQFD